MCKSMQSFTTNEDNDGMEACDDDDDDDEVSEDIFVVQSFLNVCHVE
jgi:hypothetical protein